MNEKGNRYALAALRDKRATIASEIVALERQLRHRKDMLVHVDSCLRLLDPSIEIGAIKNKRRPQRIKLFRQGELGRLILGALREAGAPLSTAEIVARVIAAGGHKDGARATMAPRVRGNLAYLERRGKVRKSGEGKSARWRLE